MTDQLCRNFHLYSTNIFVVILPKLMTSRWRKQLLKVADLFVEIFFNDEVWPCLNFEPLFLAIVLPFTSRMNPSPLKDTQGTGIAVCILIRSLNKGRYQNTLQYESVRKIRSNFQRCGTPLTIL